MRGIEKKCVFCEILLDPAKKRANSPSVAAKQTKRCEPNQTKHMNVKTEKAVSATRIDDKWILQSAYGRTSRPADASESQALESAWNGDINGSGDPWVALPLPLALFYPQQGSLGFLFRNSSSHRGALSLCEHKPKPGYAKMAEKEAADLIVAAKNEQ